MKTPTDTETATTHIEHILFGRPEEVRAALRAVLTDYDGGDAEQCPACDAVNDMCPYHRGVEDGVCLALRHIGAYSTHLGNDFDARVEFFA